jgi:hypothetical protein
VIGGTQAGAGNVISGNTTGLLISGIGHTVIGGLYNSVVQRNLIGLNAAGTAALGNGTGVVVTNASNEIGGTAAVAGVAGDHVSRDGDRQRGRRQLDWHQCRGHRGHR